MHEHKTPFSSNMLPTAICPGCKKMVVLPAEPLYPDTPPAICSTCDTEIPDYRRESFTMPAAPPPDAVVRPVDDTPAEERRVTRGGLFRSLTGLVADRGITALQSAKDRLPG
ncbi:MAG: hypothetical protein WCH31_08675 [Actinomycetes bacterium]